MDMYEQRFTVNLASGFFSDHDDAMMAEDVVDPVPVITRNHFEEAF